MKKVLFFLALSIPSISSAGIHVQQGDSVTFSTITATTITVANFGSSINANNFKITNIGNGTSSGDVPAFNQIHILNTPIISTSIATFRTTSATPVVTPLCASITPSSVNSKVLIIAGGDLYSGAAGMPSFATIERGSTNLFANGMAYSESGHPDSVTITYLDSPSSIAQLTYCVGIFNAGSGQNIGWELSNAVGTILLVEIQ